MKRRNGRPRCLNFRNLFAANGLPPIAMPSGILEIVCLNCHLDGVNLVPLIRKPFDVLAEGLLPEKSRGDKTAIELFVAGLQGLPGTIRAILCSGRPLAPVGYPDLGRRHSPRSDVRCMITAMTEVTRILDQIQQGDPHAADQLLPLVYDELRRVAAAQMAQEKPGQTLDATGLVHEAYLRLVAPADQPSFANRRHFFVAAAEAMRRILVENARRKHRLKRGGNWERCDLEPDALAAPAERDERLVALDESLTRFAALEPEKAELVKLRWFAGLSRDAAAAVLGISPATADRWWAYARAWLRVEIADENPSEP